MDDDHTPLSVSPSSLKTKLKNTLCFSCCFSRHPDNHRQVVDSSPRLPETATDMPSLVWMKTRMSCDLKDDIKEKCMTIFNRVGNGNSKPRRHPSAEFRYDPLSYALNFEDGFDDDEAPLRNFSSRLPPSPPVKPVSVREIGTVS